MSKKGGSQQVADGGGQQKHVVLTQDDDVTHRGHTQDLKTASTSTSHCGTRITVWWHTHNCVVAHA
jgi:hypothetical protein